MHVYHRFGCKSHSTRFDCSILDLTIFVDDQIHGHVTAASAVAEDGQSGPPCSDTGVCIALRCAVRTCVLLACCIQLALCQHTLLYDCSCHSTVAQCVSLHRRCDRHSATLAQPQGKGPAISIVNFAVPFHSSTVALHDCVALS